MLEVRCIQKKDLIILNYINNNPRFSSIMIHNNIDLSIDIVRSRLYKLQRFNLIEIRKMRINNKITTVYEINENGLNIIKCFNYLNLLEQNN